MIKRQPAINPDDHIGVLHHVVSKMPSAMQDEAFSEGLVLLVEAAQSYNSKHGVPAHYWIAKKLRWGLLNWKWREIKRHGLNTELGEKEYSFASAHEARVELERLVELAREFLDDREYLSVFGPAWGLHMKELSHLLKANPSQIMELQSTARTRIQELRLL